ncbi:GntR family transcriptional regulator [Kribbella sindirgiensis]|uniref:GntR family transcriptional regulator n=1 Tax=Kribbella sindirgiensis TaxID=1124744 RepID=A0A4R0IJK5_9ACTN|nr:GntR family transcriptional regulator [Kribbella sindirgiensis]TCC31288.1 GntR family transcriptional regulator [Kribbella sindirgiensis]
MSESRESETERVTRQLRGEILDGVRPPGERLVERELAAALHVSRVPVREALKALVNEGLVTLRPRSWAVVRTFTDSDIADLTEVREAFEPLTFRLAAERRTREGLDRLRAVLDEQLVAARAKDAVVARRKAADFHEIVTELASNELLVEIERPLRSRMRWLLTQHDDLIAVAGQHLELFTAIANRDVDAAERLATEHLAQSHVLFRSSRGME